ncbi:hypothetical protein SAE01_27610 [Segetibacter aerophilus]|uniref:Uncharacterized protein n=2 Tax=Segetibacter aerophilus TaxID=670293 RepID=A0A512BEG0_9BACT|nr:hypothetical protein SAE01_27610 [Segetibacter aerophilus]
MASCSKQPYWDVPNVVNGVTTITGISTATSPGISTLDNSFTVNVTLPNAKPGDVMIVELLKQQTPSGSTSSQLLPLAGTQQNITVASNLTASVTYTKAQAQMVNAGDNVFVSWAGKTESASLVVTLSPATSINGPSYNGSSVKVIRGAGTANLDIIVAPKSGAFTGNVVVQRKNGMNAPWINVGSFAAVSQVPISGDDFAIGKDTMYYNFVATSGSNTDNVTVVVVDNDPYFFLKKSGTMAIGSTDGLNVLVNGALSATNANAILAVDPGTLMLHGGANWAVGGKSISFVPSTLANYATNSPTSAIAAYMAGIPTATANPSSGEGVYVFKIVNGPNPTNVFYGILKIISIVPNVSVSYEYRIGNTYAQLSSIK